MKKQTVFKVVSAIVAAVLPAVVAATPVLAASKSAATAPAVQTSPNALKVSPLRTDLTVAAGQSAVVKVYVFNLNSTPISVHPIENDFVAGDEKGTPAIILGENSYAPTHSLKRYMVPVKDIVVQPNSNQELDVSITVPKSAQPGGYFGAIRLAPTSASSGGQVNLSASVSSLILMTVPGPTTEAMHLTNFDVQQDGGEATSFRTPDDLSLFLRFQNTGNVQEEPAGQVNVLKGKKVVYSYNFNADAPKQSVLPDSYRRWNVPLKNIGKFGKYTIKGTFTYGSKNMTLEPTKTIWIVPTTYIYIGIGILAVIVLIIVLLVMLVRANLRGRSSRGRGNRYRR